jgi:hypothetical protein
MTQTFGSGAFVFFRARGLEPRAPTEIGSILVTHPIEANIVPTYAGDRVAASRAISLASSGLSQRGYLLRPLKRSSSLLRYAIVREECVTDSLDHSQEGTVTWRTEPDPSEIEGDHPIAREIATHYQSLRGKIVAADWSASISSYLEDRDAARVRRDGRIYWVPPQRLECIRKLGGFLSVIGIDLVICEIESQHHAVVSSVAETSLEVQIEQLEAEVEQFDGTQKPSTYARRLETYQRLRERAGLYRDALGLGVSRAEQVLGDLEQKVSTMLDLRQRTTIPRRPTLDESSPTDKRPQASVRFAGVDFRLLQEADEELTFASGEDHAKASLASLDAMGLADRWQSAGSTEVKIKNSGPPGADVTLTIRRPAKQPLRSLSASLATLGIEICS